MAQAIAATVPSEAAARKLAEWLGKIVHRVQVASTGGQWSICVPEAALSRARRALSEVIVSSNPPPTHGGKCCKILGKGAPCAKCGRHAHFTVDWLIPSRAQNDQRPACSMACAVAMKRGAKPNASRMPKRRWIVKSTGMSGRTVFVAGPFGQHEFPPPPIVSEHSSYEAADRAADRYAKRWKKYAFRRVATPYGTKGNPVNKRARRAARRLEQRVKEQLGLSGRPLTRRTSWTGGQDAFGQGQRAGSGYVRFWLWNDSEWKLNLRSSYDGVRGEPSLRESAKHYADEQAAKTGISKKFPSQVGKWKAGFILAFEKAIAAAFGPKRQWSDSEERYLSEHDVRARALARRRPAKNPPIAQAWAKMTGRQRSYALMGAGIDYEVAHMRSGERWEQLPSVWRKRLEDVWYDTTRRGSRGTTKRLVRRNGGRFLIQGLRPKHRNWVTIDYADDEDRAVLNALRRARLGDVAYRVWDTETVSEVWHGKGKDASVERWQKGGRPAGLVGNNRRTTMHRNPRISKRMQPLREHTMRLGDAMKWGRRLLDAGVPIILWDGSGWEVHLKPDDSLATSSGRGAAGARSYLARGAGLIKTWPITMVADKVAGGWVDVPRIKHFLAHRRAGAGAASNPGACSNPICRSAARNPGHLHHRPKSVTVYCRMCGEWDKAKGPYKAATEAGWMTGKLACLSCRKGIAGLKRAKYDFKTGRMPGRRRVRKNQGDAGDNPRIAHEEIVGAFLAGRSKRIGPRYWTDGQLLRVWGNLVAKKVPGGVDIMDAGYQTLLTKNVLNTVLRHLGHGTIWQQRRQWYISTPQGKEEWRGEYTIPTGGVAANRRRRARRNPSVHYVFWRKTTRGKLLKSVPFNSKEDADRFARQLRTNGRHGVSTSEVPEGAYGHPGSNPRVRAWNIVAYIPGKPERWTMQSGIKDKKRAEETAKVYRDIAKKERRRHRYVVEPFRYSDTASRRNPLTQKEVDQLRRNETFYTMGARIEARAGRTKDAMSLTGAAQESRSIRETYRARGVQFRPGPQGLTLRQQDALPNPTSNAWNVYLRGKLIDTVFYSASAKVTADEVYRSLVNHDGYDPGIRVVRARRRARRNPLTRREAAGEIREIINAREQSLTASRKVGGRDASNWQDGYAHGVAGAVYRRGPASARKAVERAVRHDVRNRVDRRGRAAANPRGAGLKGLMNNGAAKKAMSFA